MGGSAHHVGGSRTLVTDELKLEAYPLGGTIDSSSDHSPGDLAHRLNMDALRLAS
jgi:hypothetical protein